MYYNQFKYLEQLPDIKIFLSSTFRDLDIERETLMKKVFPKIEADLRIKGINMSVIDLRWGIKEEDIHSGDTLSLCLDSVEKCKPYFIGLLGGRYGWIPTAEDVYKDSIFYKNNKEVMDYYINDNKSITEMEIRFGVLDRKEPNNIISRFYFGDEEIYLDSKENYSNLEEYNVSCIKQKALKEEIKKIEGLTGPTFKSIEDITTIIAKDIEKLIKDSIDEELDKQNIKSINELSDAQRKYLNQYSYEKQKTDGYIMRKCDSDIAKYVEDIKNNITKKSIIVKGDSGVGKSAALAKIAMDIRKDNQVELIRCYIGTQSGVSTQSSLIKSILADMNNIYNIDRNIPNKDEDLITTFGQWINKLGKPTIIIIDAINQLEDSRNALDFIPNILPKNVGIIISATKDYDIGQKKFYTMYIDVFTKEEKSNYIKTYLKKYSKDIEPSLLYFLTGDTENMECIIGGNVSITNSLIHSNPVFLRTLLNEICLTGKQNLDIGYTKVNNEEYQRQMLSYLILDENVQNVTDITDIVGLVKYYWQSYDLKEFFVKVLDRYEHDYGRDLVKEVCSYLILTRNGLFPSELVEIIVDIRKNNALLYYALMSLLEDKLILINGRYKAYHNYIINAMIEKYKDFNIECSEILEDYFEKTLRRTKIDEKGNPHQYFGVDKLSEYTYQLIKAKKWNKWWDILNNPEYLRTYYRLHSDEIKVNIINVSTSLNKTYNGLFTELVDKMSEGDKWLIMVEPVLNTLLNHFREIELCENLLKKIIAIKIKSSNVVDEDFWDSWTNLGKIYTSKGDYDEAIEIFNQMLGKWIQKHGENCIDVWNIWIMLAGTYSLKGEFEEAIQLYEKAEKKLIEKYGKDAIQIWRVWNNLGIAYRSKREYSKAIDILEKAEKKVTDKYGEDCSALCTVWINLGVAYFCKSENYNAIEVLKKAERKIVEMHGEDYPVAWDIFMNLGNVYASYGQYNKAIEILHNIEQKRIKKYGEDYPGVWDAWINLGAAYMYKGDYDKSLALYNKVVKKRIAKYGEENLHVWEVWSLIGKLYGCKGEFKKAIVIYLKAEHRIIEKYGEDFSFLWDIWQDLANAYGALGDYDKALELFKKVENKWEVKYGDNYLEQSFLWDSIGNIYLSLGQIEKGIKKLEKAENMILREYGEDYPKLWDLWHSLGNAYKSLKEFDKAIELYKRVDNKWLLQYGEDHLDLWFLWNSIGDVYISLGYLDKAMEVLKKAENKIIRKFGEDYHKLWGIWVNLADVYYLNKDFEEAIKVYEKAEKKMLKKYGDDYEELLNIWSNLTVTYHLYSNELYKKMNYYKVLEFREKAMVLCKKLFIKNPAVIELYLTILKDYVDITLYMCDEEELLKKLKRDFVDFIELKCILVPKYKCYIDYFNKKLMSKIKLLEGMTWF